MKVCFHYSANKNKTKCLPKLGIFKLVAEVIMKTSIVDFKDNTNDILKALDRNESVTVLYQVKVKGVIKPVREKALSKIIDHPFFGMYRNSEKSVLGELENLRKMRYDL